MASVKDGRNYIKDVTNSLQDSNRTTKRVESKESMNEVRMLLEYLFLDVKVRSPEEVSYKILSVINI